MTSQQSEVPVLRVTMFCRCASEGQHSIEGVFATIRSCLPEDIEIRLVEMDKAGAGPVQQLRNLHKAWKHRGEINHITGDIHYLALVLPRGRTVLTIHDVAPLHSLRGARRLVYRFWWLWLPMHRAALVTTISDFTRHELRTLISRARSEIVVVPNPVNPQFIESQPKGGRPGGPILCVGTKENKNLERIIKALDGSQERLTLIGHPTERQRKQLVDADVSVEVKSNLDMAEMIALYRDAGFLLFPSLYEGFGLPIVEAQAMGLAVVTSDREPMRSTSGDGALLVNPESIDDIRAAISMIRSDQNLRQSLVRRGSENVVRFSPAGAGNAFGNIYRRLACGSKMSGSSVCSQNEQAN